MPTYVNSGTAQAVNSSSATIPITVASGTDRLMHVDVHLRGGATISDVTVNGSSIISNEIGSGALGGTANNNGRRVRVFYLIAPPVGTYNVVVTLSASELIVANAHVFTGAHQTAPHRTPDIDTQIASATLQVDPTSESSDLCVSYMSNGDGASDNSADGGQFLIYEAINLSCYGGAAYLAGSSSSTAMPWSVATPTSGIGQALFGVAIKPPAASGGAARLIGGKLVNHSILRGRLAQ